MAREMDEDDPRYIPDDLVERMKEERSVLGDADEGSQAKRIFTENVAAAASTIARIAVHGSTERVRMDASKYIVERVLGPVSQEGGMGDPLKDFLQDVSNFANRTAAKNGE